MNDLRIQLPSASSRSPADGSLNCEPNMPQQLTHGVHPNAAQSEDRSARSEKPLTARQRRFIAEYMVDLNAAAAARRSGYSEKTARTIGQENLTKPDIVAGIVDARRRLIERCEVTVEWIVKELMKIADANLLDYVQIHPDGSMTPDATRILRDLGGAVADYWVEEVVIVSAENGRSRTVKRRFHIKMGNKLAALQALGKHLGMFRGEGAKGHAIVQTERVVVIYGGSGQELARQI